MDDIAFKGGEFVFEIVDRFNIQIDAFEVMMGDTVKRIGEVSAETRLKITGLNGDPIVDADVKALKESWQQTLRFSEVSK